MHTDPVGHAFASFSWHEIEQYPPGTPLPFKQVRPRQSCDVVHGSPMVGPQAATHSSTRARTFTMARSLWYAPTLVHA